MLTSSEAKWRCMWHMLVWSIIMTLVSQFMDIRNQVAFFLFAAITVLILPALTAIYSNTAGKHGAGLLRAGYIFCDPVLVCITVLPSLIIKRLPQILDEYFCLKNFDTRNQTLVCLKNKTTQNQFMMYENIFPWRQDEIIIQQQNEFLMVEVAIVTPVLLALAMGKRTKKMHYNSSLLNFAYWFIGAIDATELLETSMLSKSYKHVIFTTEALVAIAMVLSNSYAVVTLCSYLTPADPAHLEKEGYCKKFDFLYKAVVGTLGMCFCEIPMLIARFQILFTNVNRIVYGTFFLWIVKNIMFILMIVFIVFIRTLRKKFSRIPCRPIFDSDATVFKPEKRDVYIYRHQEAGRPSSLKKHNLSETESSKEKKRVTFKMDELRKLRINPKPSGSSIEAAETEQDMSQV